MVWGVPFAACLEKEALRLEPENDAPVIPEVALVVVAAGEAVAKTSQHKIKLRPPDGNRLA